MGKRKAPKPVVCFVGPYHALPGYLSLGHKSLEKGDAEPIKQDRNDATYAIPLDLVRLTLPEDLSSDVAGVEVIYRRSS